MAYEIGTAYIQVVPSFRHIQEKLEAGAKDIADKFANAAERSIPPAMLKGVEEGNALAGAAAEEGGESAGHKFGDHFAIAVRTRMAAALSHLPDVELKGDSSDVDRSLVSIRERIEALAQQDINLDVNDKTVIRKIQKIRADLRLLEERAPTIRLKLDAAAARVEAEAFLSSIQDRQGAFSRAWRADLAKAISTLPKPEVDLDVDPAAKRLQVLRRQLELLSEKTIGVHISEEDALNRLASIRRSLERVAKRSESLELRYNADQAMQAIDATYDRMVTSGERAQRQLREDHDRQVKEKVKRDADEARARAEAEFGRSFAGTMQKHINEAFEASSIKPKVDPSGAHKALVRINRELKSLKDQHIGVDVDEATAVAKLRKLHAQLSRIVQTAESVELRVHADKAKKAVEAAFDSMTTSADKAMEEQRQKTERLVQQRATEAARETRKLAERQEAEAKRNTDRIARETEERFSHTFGGKVRKQLDEALKSLPDLELSANPTQAMLWIKAIRENLEQLSGKKVGVDIDEAEAMKQIAEIKAALVDLARNDPSIQVHSDTAAAAAALARIETIARRLDGRDIGMDVNVRGDRDVDAIGRAATVSLSRIEALIAGGLSLGTVLVPAAAAAAASISYIATAAVAAGAGIGALVLSFGGIGTAVKAMQQLQDDKAKSDASFSRTSAQQENAIDRIAAAERSLANTRANNAEAARSAGRAVVDAERAVGEARVAAIERQADAERTLTRAQVDAREAREGLTRAYRDAVAALADLDSAVKKNALDQREAALEIKKAKEDLDKFLLNPRATEDEREQARITYEQRLLQIADLKRQGEELTRQQAEATRKGVEGSAQVVAARKKIVDADQRVADAQRNVTKAREEGAQRVADAERRVSEARHAQQEQARKASVALAQAQDAVTKAARGSEQAQVRAGIAGGDAYDNVRTSLSKLSPKAQEFAKFIFSLGDDFRRLRAAAADSLLPGVQASIQNLLPFLPAFQGWIGRVAKAVGDMFVQTSHLLSTDGTWRKFFSHIASNTVPTLQQLYRVAMNVVTGVVGLVNALAPFNTDIGGGLEKLTERFAKWASTLEQNVSFQRFLAYVRETGPGVIALIGELSDFVGRFVIAAAPIGAVVLQGLTLFVGALNAIPINVLTELVFAMGAFAAITLFTSGVSRSFALVQGTVLKVVERSTTAWGGLKNAGIQVRDTMVQANARTGELGRGLAYMQGAAGLAKKGLSGLVGFFGGPWGVAITAAILAAGYFAKKAMDQQQAVQRLTDALGLLGEAYRKTRDYSSDAVRDIVRQSEELKKLIGQTSEYGFAVEDVIQAASGEEAAQRRVIAALEAKKKANLDALKATHRGPASDFKQAQRIMAENDAIDAQVGALRKNFDQINANALAQDALGAAQDEAIRRAPTLTDAQRKQADIMADNAAKIDYLKSLIRLYGDEQLTAAGKADILRRAIESQTGAKINAIEAEEREAAARRGVQATIESNRQSLQHLVDEHKISAAEADRQSKSLTDNSDAAGRNRDALEEAAGAVRERFLADIASGMPMDKATQAHKDRIEALTKEADKAYNDKEKTRELIDAYGDIPPEAKTVMESDEEGFKKVYRQLEMLQVAQWALEYHVDPKTAWNQYLSAQQEAENHGQGGDGIGVFSARSPAANVAPRFSTGGRVWGEGTSTSDSIMAWLSNREFVQPASSVDYYGEGLMQAIRHRQLPREMFPGFAKGGAVTWPFPVSFANTFIPQWEHIRDGILSKEARSTGGIGSDDMMRLLRAVFPGLALYSGYRPGSRTPSGNLSYHAMIAADGDKGRAVDLPPKREVFNWIHDNYFKATRELIWLGDKFRNIWNGQHHKFSDSLLANHGTAGMPNGHIHWAYDQGGYLPPGVTTVFNGTGRPEPVFTDTQWSQIGALVRNNHAEPAGETHHWHFRESALDHGRLNAWANAREARGRPGRPN